MIIDILTHTPTWVFVVFGLLLVVGIRLSRPTRVAMPRLLIVPVAMAALSVLSLVQTFGATSAGVAVWALLAVGGVALGCVLPRRSDVQYSSADHRLTVPGSWLPLILMMTIFFTRYTVGVLLAMHPDLASSLSFTIAVATLGGLTSGTFAARAARIVRVALGAGHATIVGAPA